MEGPKVPSEARRREAPEGGWGLGRGAVAPPQYGGLAPRKIFKKSTLKSLIFLHFCKLKWSHLHFFSCSFGEARLNNRCKPILALAQSCNIVDTFLGRAPGRAVSGAKPTEAERFCFGISQGRSHFSPHFKFRKLRKPHIFQVTSH